MRLRNALLAAKAKLLRNGDDDYMLVAFYFKADACAFITMMHA